MTDPLFDITGKTILVTGASSGIGLHLAGALASRGARVIAASRSATRSAALAAVAGAGEVVPLDMDIASASSVEQAFGRIRESCGSLQAIVNSAGIAEPQRGLDMTPDDWHRTIDTNLTGAFLVAQAGARLMTGGGSIIMIASIGAAKAVAGLAAYAAAKSGVVMMSRTLALELAATGIRVNVLMPGYVVTPMNDTFLAGPGGEKILRKVPMRRFAQPSDLEGAVVFLCADGSGYVTGASLAVDGGFLA